MPRLDEIAEQAPEQFEDAGQALSDYGQALLRAADSCQRAVESEDFDVLRDETNADIELLGTLATDIAHDLPSDIECPEDVTDRPETCDA